MVSKCSKLKGSYLLIVLGQPWSDSFKELQIKKVSDGLLSWSSCSADYDVDDIKVACLKAKNENLESEILFQYCKGRLAIEVLYNPQTYVLQQCLKNMLLSPTGHKQLIFAGYSFTGTGSWVLEDGVFKFQDLIDIFQDKNISNFFSSLRYGSFHVHIHCPLIGDWSPYNLDFINFSKLIEIYLNPKNNCSQVLNVKALLDLIKSKLKILNIESQMVVTPSIGKFQFNKPTLYIFPSGQGDSSLFGISNFTMLIDGGFKLVPSFWKLIRHLEKIDLLLITRLNENNILGLSSFFKQKLNKPFYPKIGHIFCNIKLGKTRNVSQTQNDLSINVIKVVQECIKHIKNNINFCFCEFTTAPITLYHKIGHGTLELIILSPFKDSRLLKDFFKFWENEDERFTYVRTISASFTGEDIQMPISDVMSICYLLIWKPSNPNEKVIRILFSGGAPQSQILEGLDRVKNFHLLKNSLFTSKLLKSKMAKKYSSQNNYYLSAKNCAKNNSISNYRKSLKKLIDIKPNFDCDIDQINLLNIENLRHDIFYLNKKNYECNLKSKDEANQDEVTCIKNKSIKNKIKIKSDADENDEWERDSLDETQIRQFNECTENNLETDSLENSDLNDSLDKNFPVQARGRYFDDVLKLSASEFPRFKKIALKKREKIENIRNLIKKNGHQTLKLKINENETKNIENKKSQIHFNIIDVNKSKCNQKFVENDLTTSHDSSDFDYSKLNVKQIFKKKSKFLGQCSPRNKKEGIYSRLRKSSLSRNLKKVNNHLKLDGKQLKKKTKPVFVDLAYIPHNADKHYCNSEYFTWIRARYYVLSAVNPSLEVLNSLIKAKKIWENVNSKVTLIPTYETDALFDWMFANQEQLAKLNIDVVPSANRCVLKLENTDCSAYKIEFY